MSGKVKFSIGIVGIACIASICLFTGCFKKQDVQVPQQFMVQENSYEYLIDNWNKAVISNHFDDKYLLPRDDNSKSLHKLNDLLNNIQTVKAFQHKSQCPLKYPTRTIFTPTAMYFQFLKENANYGKIDFTIKDKEDDIISKLKNITSSRYFDEEVVKKVVYLHSFKIYFEKNKKTFYKQGFTRNVKDFKIYQTALDRCK